MSPIPAPSAWNVLCFSSEIQQVSFTLNQSFSIIILLFQSMIIDVPFPFRFFSSFLKVRHSKKTPWFDCRRLEMHGLVKCSRNRKWSRLNHWSIVSAIGHMSRKRNRRVMLYSHIVCLFFREYIPLNKFFLKTLES